MLTIILSTVAVFGIATGEETQRIMKLDSQIYCGPYGGYKRNEGNHKYPIETREKARAALSYAYWAPNPEGIRNCVCKYYPDMPSCIDRARKK